MQITSYFFFKKITSKTTSRLVAYIYYIDIVIAVLLEYLKHIM
jgi:hypothetical protein